MHPKYTSNFPITSIRFIRINPPKSCYGTIPYRICSLLHQTGAQFDILEDEMKMIRRVV